LNYSGDLPPLVICGLGVLKIDPPELFANLTADCHLVAAKSRRYSTEDREFIEKEVQRLLKEGIIEPSNSSLLRLDVRLPFSRELFRDPRDVMLLLKKRLKLLLKVSAIGDIT